MKLYDDNIQFLGQFNAALLNHLISIPEKNYVSEPSKSGPLTLIRLFQNQQYYLHSKYNPEAEAVKLLQNTNLNADHIIVLGLGAGYHLEKIMTLKAPSSRVLLIEPDLEIIKLSLKTLPWRTIFNHPDFFYAFGPDLNQISNIVHSFMDMITFEKVEYIELPSEVRFFPEYFKSARDRIENDIKTELYDFKTRLAEDAMVPKNILKNIVGILHTRPASALKNKFTGKPGFIVSAGPSLDKNVLHLKKLENRGMMICVDTALKPLLKRGIHPHFTVTADPSYKNYCHLLGTESQIKHFIVTDTGISTRVYSDFSKNIFSISLGRPIVRMIEQNIGPIGEVDAWGSVISLALNFAIYLGLDPIVFLGQDFAFTGMRNHCRGTSWEENWTESIDSLAELQRKEKQSISGVVKMLEPLDIYGRKTMTSDRLMLYKNYLAKTLTSLPGHRFINATGGGILTEIETKDLHEVMKQFVFNQKPIDINQLLSIPEIYNPQNKKQLLIFFKAKSAFFKKYKKKMTEMLEQLENASSRLPFSAQNSLLNDAETLKRLLYSNVQHGEIVEMWSQAPIYSFLKKSTKLHNEGITPANISAYISLFEEYFQKMVPLIATIIDSFEAGIDALSDASGDIR